MCASRGRARETDHVMGEGWIHVPDTYLTYRTTVTLVAVKTFPTRGELSTR